MLKISEEIRDLYESTSGIDLDNYLTRIANMGFQVYAVNERYEGQVYGDPFKHSQIAKETIKHVLDGGTYHGVMEEEYLLKVAGYFENSIRNTVGLPVRVGGESFALFIRPNLQQQIGEVRVLLAILLGHGFLFSIAIIILLTRFIVVPLKKLTAATKKIVGGDYKMQLDVKRQDEIGNLARHFAQMAKSIEHLDEMRQEFVANVSHEFQTPVTSIHGFTQAMLKQETTPEEDRRYLQIIHDESKRLSAMSKQLLTLAMLEKEANVMKKTAYRLDEQIRQVLIVLEWQWADKQLSIEPHLPELIITADAQFLYQVWFNLLTNSIKFTPQGGTIRITMSVEQEVVVEISDTGCGIPAADLQHIYDRFYKADKARNYVNAGSGLGLAITKKVVDLHQGEISVQSEPGKGTTFTIKLPYL